MTIFADFHHAGLASSLQLLFEKRLGHKLYFPYGMEWYETGNWKIGDPYGAAGVTTAQQFLTGRLPEDGTGVVNVPNKMTLQEFIDTPIDLIIASYYHHIAPYKALRDMYHPNAKLIFQMGNQWFLTPEDMRMVDGLLASIKPFGFIEKPVVFYHQEFDTSLYCYSEEYRGQHQLASFTNALPLSDMYSKDWKDFQEFEQLLQSEYICCSFGGGCRNGSFKSDDVAEVMKSLDYAIHFKEGGDGYGHIIHQLAATGTPVIFKGHQYVGKLAQVFLEDGKTGFDVDSRSLEGVADAIKAASKDERLAMGREIRRRFDTHVNFDVEAQEIRAFLSSL